MTYNSHNNESYSNENLRSSCCKSPHYKYHNYNLTCCDCPTNLTSGHCHSKWSEIPYPNQIVPYVGIEKNAGTWPLFFLKFTTNKKFCSLSNKCLCCSIEEPCNIDFNKELVEVETVLENLTPCQIAIAKFWGTGVPVEQWTPIALKLINTYKVNPPRSARILSAVQNVINDAFVVTWFYKYCTDLARPIQLNKELKTVLDTPKFPTYPSGHSTVSSAASVVLSYFFPAESIKLNKLAKDASISRLYCGIHFRSDLENGLELGKQIGEIAVDILSKQVDECNKPIDIPYTQFLDAPIIPNYC